MNVGGVATNEEGLMPVVILPHSLTFYTDEPASHKQVLTLYNIYDFDIKFKVFCTASKKYSVVDSEGVIRKRQRGDILIRHNDICMRNEGVRDKFRIQLQEYGQKTILGRKDIPVVLLARRSADTASPEERFESLPASSAASAGVPQSSFPQARAQEKQGLEPRGPDWVVLLSGLLCIIALMLPLAGEAPGSSCLPDYLHLTNNQKLIAAYVLGLVTMAILRRS